MQEDGKDGKDGKDEMDERLKGVGSETKSRLDAAINDPAVAKVMADKAAKMRIEELKARAREPPKPRPQVSSCPKLFASVPCLPVLSGCECVRANASAHNRYYCLFPFSLGIPSGNVR